MMMMMLLLITTRSNILTMVSVVRRLKSKPATSERASQPLMTLLRLTGRNEPHALIRIQQPQDGRCRRQLKQALLVLIAPNIRVHSRTGSNTRQASKQYTTRRSLLCWLGHAGDTLG